MAIALVTLGGPSAARAEVPTVLSPTTAKPGEVVTISTSCGSDARVLLLPMGTDEPTAESADDPRLIEAVVVAYDPLQFVVPAGLTGTVAVYYLCDLLHVVTGDESGPGVLTVLAAPDTATADPARQGSPVPWLLGALAFVATLVRPGRRPSASGSRA